MALCEPINDDLTTPFNNVYAIYRDLSGWDFCTVQLVAPVLGTVYVYGTNDPGATAYSQGSAALALNYTPIQATKLSDGTTVNSMSAAGLYKVSINQRFMKLQGNPAGSPTNIYRLILFNSKES